MLNKKLTDLSDVMKENIEKILQREEKVELFVKRTQKTDKYAMEIKNNASKIKNQEFWRSNKCKIMIAAILVAAGLAFFFVIWLYIHYEDVISQVVGTLSEWSRKITSLSL